VKIRIKNLWRRIQKHDETSAAILGVMVAVVALLFGFYQYNYNVENQKKETTIQYLVGFSELLANSNPVLLDTMNFFGNKSKEYDYLHVDTLEKILQKNKMYRVQLDNIMVYLNQLAIGCKEEFYDEYTVCGANYYQIVNSTNALIPYFKIREKEENMNGRDERICWYLRNMVRRWYIGEGKYKEWGEKDRKEIEELWRETYHMEMEHIINKNDK
jgi:hypothetical protein